MKRYHITYFIDVESKTLTGVTIESPDMIKAIHEFTFLHGIEKMTKIKYIIEL